MKTPEKIISEAVISDNSLKLDSGMLDWGKEFKPVKDQLASVGGVWTEKVKKFIWPEGTDVAAAIKSLGVEASTKVQKSKVNNNLPLF